jgi:hypothetical protein
MLRKYHNTHSEETCVVIGNGPSLNDTPLKKLSENFTTFGSNKIFLYPFTPNYYVVIDHDMMHDCSEQLISKNFSPPVVFVPRGIPIPGSNQMNLTVEFDFSLNINEKVVMGGTVTFAMLQIAFYMGFTTALLVGVDHNYPGASKGGKPGHKFVANGPDLDHFDPNYFTTGRIYNRPELEGTERYYQLAKEHYGANGRKIINLSADTKLDVFERQKVAQWVSA